MEKEPLMTCPVCYAPPEGSMAPGAGEHAPVPHLVADEMAADGYTACGHDTGSGLCVRDTGHDGTHAVVYDLNPSFLSPPYVEVAV
jgi:hypothetical protein